MLLTVDGTQARYRGQTVGNTGWFNDLTFSIRQLLITLPDLGELKFYAEVIRTSLLGRASRSQARVCIGIKSDTTVTATRIIAKKILVRKQICLIIHLTHAKFTRLRKLII